MKGKHWLAKIKMQCILSSFFLSRCSLFVNESSSKISPCRLRCVECINTFSSFVSASEIKSLHGLVDMDSVKSAEAFKCFLYTVRIQWLHRDRKRKIIFIIFMHRNFTRNQILAIMNAFDAMSFFSGRTQEECRVFLQAFIIQWKLYMQNREFRANECALSRPWILIRRLEKFQISIDVNWIAFAAIIFPLLKCNNCHRCHLMSSTASRRLIFVDSIFALSSFFWSRCVIFIAYGVVLIGKGNFFRFFFPFDSRFFHIFFRSKQKNNTNAV